MNPLTSIVLGAIADTHIRQEEQQGSTSRIQGYQDNSLPQFVDICNDYDGEGTVVDMVVQLGDVIAPVNQDIAAELAIDFQEWVSWVDGTHPLSDGGFPTDVAYTVGNHAFLIEPATTAGFDTLFSSNDGMGDILPTGQTNFWWPNGGVNVTDGLPMCYTMDVKGFTIISLFSGYGSSFPDGYETVGEDYENTDPSFITQVEWFEKVMLIAETAGKPVIVLSHNSFKSTEVEYNPDSPQGAGLIVTIMENQTIKPVVIMGHSHVRTSILVSNGVTYINLRADCWGIDGNTDRFSHAIIEINSDAVWDGTAAQVNVQVTGYGYQDTKLFTRYLVA